MCRHADDRADRHDAGSAYARYHQRTFVAADGPHRIPYGLPAREGRRRLTQPAPFDGHETRAEAIEARAILVEGRQDDGSLAAEFRLHRDDVQAIERGKDYQWERVS